MHIKAGTFFISLLLVILAFPIGLPFDTLATQNEGDEYLTVYCMFPGKPRKLGKKVIMTGRHLKKTSAMKCEASGGEYEIDNPETFAYAVKDWKPNSKEKNPIEQTDYGEIYEKGGEYEEAAKWYRKAAEQDNSKAQILLGNLYEKGLGVEKDFNKALYWYRRASGLDDAIKIENGGSRLHNAPGKDLVQLPALPLDLKSKNFGRYYALIIGNQDYYKWPTLETPTNDAYKTGEILTKKYGFTTKVLINATRSEIFKALEAYKDVLNDQDNLLVYYAGHGDFETKLEHTYWVPVDGEIDSKAYWISTFDITSQIDIIPAKHVLVISDSCYSGGLTISAIARRLPGMSEKSVRDWIDAVSKKSSRTVLTSGGKTPVLDGGGSGHSVFAKALLNVLETNDGIIEGIVLYSQIKDKVIKSAKQYNFEQVPSYAPLKFANHEGGEFIFVPK